MRVIATMSIAFGSLLLLSFPGPAPAATCDTMGGTTRGCVPVVPNWRVDNLPQRFPSRLAATNWAAANLATVDEKAECQYGPLLQPSAPTPCKGTCTADAGYFPEKELWHAGYGLRTWGFTQPYAGYPNGHYNVCTVGSADMDPVCPEGFSKVNEYLPGSKVTYLCRPNSSTGVRGAERFAGIPDTPGCRDKTTDGCTMGKNPVNLASRTKYDMVVDYQNHSPFPIVWARSYSSTAKRWTFSYDRSLVFDHFPSTSKAYATLYRDDGSTIRYKSDNAGSGTTPWTWVLDQGAGRQVVRSQLSETRDGNGNVSGLALKTLHDEVEYYNLQGQLVSIEGRGGFGLLFDYDQEGRLIEIHDDFGRSLQVSYDPSHRVASTEQYEDPNDPNTPLEREHLSFPTEADRVLDRAPSQISDGEVIIQYGYETIELLSGLVYPRLSEVLQADGTTIDYRYGENSSGVESTTSGLLTGIIGGDGQRFATYKYATSDGKMSSSVHGNGLREILYGSSQIEDAYGKSYSFSTTQASTTGKTGGTSQRCPDTICSGARAKSITYDNYGNPIVEIDYEDVETRRTYDTDRALPLTITQAYGTPKARQVSYTWHPDFRVPLTRVEPIETQGVAGTRTTTWTYDTNGNRLTETVSNSLNSQVRARSWSYNTSGLLETHTNFRGKITEYTYDANGNLIAVENAKGQVATLGDYTPRGLVGKITDPNGLQTKLTYDERDRVIKIERGSASSGWETSTISYLDIGKVGRTTRPDGTYTVFVYDSAHDLVEIQEWSNTDVLVGKTVFTLDLAGRLTKQESFDGNAVKIASKTLSYDTLSRLSSTTGSQNQQNIFSYDDNARLLGTEDPMAHTNSSNLDVLGRAVSLIDEMNNASLLEYDPQDNIIQATDAKGVATQYEFSAFNDLMGLVSPDRGAWGYEVDAQGNRVLVVDPRGIEQDVVYDDLDRVVSSGWSDDMVVGTPVGLQMGDRAATYTYDTCTNGIGRLCSKTDWTGTTGYSYDLWGRLVGEAFAPTGESFTLATGYSYDAFGRPDAVVYPSGKVLAYAYGTDGRIASIDWAGSGLVGGLTHQAMGGPVMGWNWSAAGLPAGSSQVAYTYDQDGQMAHISDIEEIDVVHNLDGQITGVGHLTGTDLDMAYDYDAKHRLVEADNALWSAPMLYAWDAGSNRTSKTWDTDSWVNAYGVSSNRLVSRTPYTGGVAGTSISPSYDAMGNVIEFGGTTFSYDATGRMVEASSGGSSAQYQVNAEGLRVRKTVTGLGAIDAFAVYDDQRRRIGTYRPDGLGGFTVDEELVYLPDTWRILATVRGQVAGGANGTAWPVLTDHLGAPRAVLDPTSGDVRWTWSAREAFGHQAPNETPGSAGAFVFDARFPGQFLDAETGLFHNGYRDYSPQWGRYIQSDPIGLEAGWNTYEYVGGDPVGAYDPLGLRSWSPWGVQKQASEDASTNVKTFPNNVDGLKNDAYRHCLASCEISRRWSPPVAKALGDIYEASNKLEGAYSASCEMDYHNNRVGRVMGRTATSYEDCKTRCSNSVNADFTINGFDFSDQRREYVND